MKVLKKPRFDLSKLMDMHEGGGASTGAVDGIGEDMGEKTEKADGYEPPVLEAV